MMYSQEYMRSNGGLEMPVHPHDHEFGPSWLRCSQGRKKDTRIWQKSFLNHSNAHTIFPDEGVKFSYRIFDAITIKLTGRGNKILEGPVLGWRPAIRRRIKIKVQLSLKNKNGWAREAEMNQ